MVTVAGTHRRRGLLRRMLSESLDAARQRGDAVAILFAAEWAIYGRFGYAPASFAASYELDPRLRGASLPMVAAGGCTLRQVERAELGKYGPEIFEAARRQRAGNIDREPFWWERTLGLHGLAPTKVRGRIPTFVLHTGAEGPDGYVGWAGNSTMDDGSADVDVIHLCAATPEAYRNLWAYLTNLDLVERIRLTGRPVDEPVRWLLGDGRALRQTRQGDGLWLRLLDVPAALSARRYAVADELTFDVVDEDVGGYAAGRFMLRADPDGAECVSSPGSAVDLRIAPARTGVLLSRRGEPASPARRRADRGDHAGCHRPGRHDVRHGDRPVVCDGLLTGRQVLSRRTAAPHDPASDGRTSRSTTPNLVDIVPTRRRPAAGDAPSPGAAVVAGTAGVAGQRARPAGFRVELVAGREPAGPGDPRVIAGRAKPVRHGPRASPHRHRTRAGSIASGCSAAGGRFESNHRLVSRSASRRRAVRCRSQPARTDSPLALGARELRQPFEGLAELARHDPHLVRVALGDLRQRLQVLVGEQGRIGFRGVDRPEGRLDRLGLALRGRGTARPAHLRRAGFATGGPPPRPGSPTASGPSAARICAAFWPSAVLIADSR